MKSFRLFKTVTLSVLFLILSVCALMFAFNAKTVQATSPVFEMDKGVYVKLVDDGGLRFRVKMDETTKEGIDKEGNELFFLLMSQEKFDAANGDFSNVDCKKIPADKSLIYYSAKDESYYSNLLIYNIPENMRAEYLCVVAGKTVDGETSFASYESATQVCKTFYNAVNASLVDLGMAEILDVYTWLGTEEYPVMISTQAQYDSVVALVENEIDLTGKYVEIGAGIERDLAYESEAFAGVNLIKNELVVTFMANDVVYETVQVAKNALVTAPATNPDASDESTVYAFIGWDYDFATAVTEDIVINANFKLLSKDITSIVNSAFRDKVALVSKTTWSDYGKLKWGQNNYKSTDDGKYVDISAYQGMILEITMPYTGGSYGLVFYDADKTAKTDDGWYLSVASGTSGEVYLMEILIPEGAHYLRTIYYSSNGSYASSVTSTPFSAVVRVETTKDITSLFTWNNKTAIRAKTTFTDYGVLKYSMNNYVGSNYVDVSSYQGKTLKITMINSDGNGLVFYDESKVAQKNDGWSAWNNSSSLGDVHVMEITIPEGAHYVRTTYYRGGDGAYANSAATTPFSAIILLYN